MPAGASALARCEIRTCPRFDNERRALERRHHHLAKKLDGDGKNEKGLLAELADNPTLGDRIPGLRNIFKIRIKGEGAGKRGGYRVIYYYEESLVVPITIFAKGDKEDVPNAILLEALRAAGIGPPDKSK